MACIEIVNYTSGTILGTYASESECDDDCGICCTSTCNYDTASILFAYQEWTTGYSATTNQPVDCDACWGNYFSQVGNNSINHLVNKSSDGLGASYPGLWKSGFPASDCGAIIVQHSSSWMSEFSNRCDDTCAYYDLPTALRTEFGERSKTLYFVCTGGGWEDKTSDAFNPHMSNIGDLFASVGTVRINSGGVADTNAMCCWETYGGPSLTYNTLDYDLASSSTLSYSCKTWDPADGSPITDCEGNPINNNGASCCNMVSSSSQWVACNCADSVPSGHSYGACVTITYGQISTCDKKINEPASYGPQTPSTTGEAFDYSCAAVNQSECPPTDSQCPDVYFWRTGKLTCTDHECEAQMNASASSETP